MKLPKPAIRWQGFSGEQKRCEMCGAWFVPRRRDQRYHTNACRQKAYRRKQVRWSGDVAGNVYRDGKWWGVRESPVGSDSFGPVDGIVWEGTGVVDEPPTTIPEWARTPAVVYLDEAARWLYAAAKLCDRPTDADKLRKAARELRQRAKAAARAARTDHPARRWG